MRWRVTRQSVSLTNPIPCSKKRIRRSRGLEELVLPHVLARDTFEDRLVAAYIDTSWHTHRHMHG
jgi:hypothetical protein